MKKIIYFLTCFTLLVSLTSCAKKKSEEVVSENNVVTDESEAEVSETIDTAVFSSLSGEMDRVIKSSNNGMKELNDVVFSSEFVSNEEETSETESFVTEEEGSFGEAQALPPVEAEENEQTDEDSEEEITGLEADVTEEDSTDALITSSDNKLKLFTFEDEILLPQLTQNYRIITSVSKAKVSRSFYDNRGRLCKKEKWNIPDVENAVLLKRQVFEFAEDSYIPLTQVIFENNTNSYITYNENSKPVEMKKYIILEKVQKLISKTEYKYDDENRVIESFSTEYNYNSDYSKLKEKVYKKYMFFYMQGKDIPADYEYYENNELKMKNVYSSEPGSYTSQIFFTENYNVMAYYENEVKRLEVYELDGKIVREVSYE